jgi:ATP-dependent Clp protease ATP-binding subunit ClpB
MSQNNVSSSSSTLLIVELHSGWVVSVPNEFSGTREKSVHLALALCEESDGVASRVLDKAGADSRGVVRALKRRMVRLAAQAPPPNDVSVSRALLNCLEYATPVQHKQKDSHLAQDHVLLGLMQDGGIRECVEQGGSARREDVESAVEEVRARRGRAPQAVLDRAL